jgi:hypothetical protein
MKPIALAIALSLIIGASTEANAVVCARGVYHAGCAGPRGAVGVHGAAVRPYGAAVVRPVARPYGYGAACVWRAGVRICR